MNGTISLYTNLFYVSTGVAVLGLALAVFFFFYFDIPTVYAMMTGKARKEMVQRMAEENAKTGKLRLHHGHTGETGGRSGKLGKTGRTGRTGKVRSAEVSHPAPPAQPVADYRPDTGVLSQPTADTSVLAEESGATMLLNRDAVNTPWAEETAVLRPDSRNAYPFQMTENTLVIHTDEMI